MRCTNCGTEVPGGSFCPQCGAQLVQEQAYQYQVNPYAAQPPSNAVQTPGTQTLGNPTQVLVFGILGLALSELGIVGLIFSILALTKASKYIETYGNVSTQVRVGRGLAIGGLVVSILAILYIIFLIVVVCIVVASGTASELGSSVSHTYHYGTSYL